MELVFGDDAVLLADEAEVELIHGPQGGYHVVAGVRMIGVDADGKIVVYRATRERDGALLSEMRYGITARRLTADGAFRVRSGDFVILDVTGPDQIAGELLTVEARLETSEGAELATDVRTLSVIDTVDENP